MSNTTLAYADGAYATFEAAVARAISANSKPLFTTAAVNLWELYLLTIPEAQRQHYNCHACKDFIRRYGGLVSIDPETGQTESLLWGTTGLSGVFDVLMLALKARVEKAAVTGPFLWKEDVWGRPQTGDWTHLHGVPAFKHNETPLKKIHEQIAERRLDFILLQTGLHAYSVTDLQQAVRVLEADALTRGEKVLEQARWLLALKNHCIDGRGMRISRNVLWHAAALAPVGWCHIGSSVLSTLLDDIKAGLGFEVIAARWAKKMHPLAYRRPQAPPKEANIDRAEEIIEKLGLAPSLRRRAARLEEVREHALWVPTQAAPSTLEGIFSGLRAEQQRRLLDIPAVPITWEKFRDTVLPKAQKLDVRLPAERTSFYGLLTAAVPEAPSIIQWDGLPEFPRNPVSWYFYSHGSHASQWGLQGGEWEPVDAILPPPPLWQDPKLFAREDSRAFFVLSRAQDKHGARLCLFPEILRASLHEVRAVIEAYSNKTDAEDLHLGTANGIAFQKESSRPLLVRVHDEAFGLSSYTIDRWS